MEKVKFNLTRRQRQTLILVCQGKTDFDISKEFCITPHSVRLLVSKLLRIYEVENRTQLALRVLLGGIPKPDFIVPMIDLTMYRRSSDVLDNANSRSLSGSPRSNA